MKQFYNVFSNEKVSPLVTQLSWTHCLILISIKNINEMYYYALQVTLRNLSKRQLNEIIKSNEYTRLSIETRNKLINEEKLEFEDIVPNPILIKNKNNIEMVSEKALHMIIMEDIESFMKELGSSFSFIGSEYKIKIGDRYNYIDLLLFNIEYNCYVVVELKIIEIKKEHVGQIQIYMNYIDKHIKKIYHDKTVGIIVCKKDSRYVIEYCSDKKIIAREYEIIL